MSISIPVLNIPHNLLGGSFDPTSITGLRARLLDGSTYTDSQIGGAWYLKDRTVENTHLPRQGRCWLFDGNNDFGVAASRITSGNPAALTVCAWIKPTSWSTNCIASEYEITGNKRIWLLGHDSGTFVLYLSSDGTAIATSRCTAPSTGVWTHVAAVYNGTTVAVYFNGVAQSITQSGAVPASLANVDAKFRMSAIVGASYPFNGSMRDARVYNSAKSASEITAIYDQSRTGVGSVDTTNLLAYYQCNEEIEPGSGGSLTTGYDSGPNAYHLTLTNIDQTTFFAADSGVLWNRNNEVGYRLASGVYIPRRLNSSLAVDGNALTVSGRAAYHGRVDVPCVTGDGSTVYVDAGLALIPPTADFDLSFWIRSRSAFNTNLNYIISQGTSPIWGLYEISGELFLYFVDGATSAVALQTNQWYFVTISRSGDLWTLTVNDVNRTRTKSGSVSSVNTHFVRRTDGSWPAAYGVSDFQITTGGVTTYFPLQDGPGSSNTNRNVAWVASDGTSGVISNAIVNGTVSTIWGTRVTGQVKDWSILYGGRIGAAGEFIAGRLTGSLAADGNAKTLVAGKVGNPFSRINLNPASAAEYNTKNRLTAYEEVPCITFNGSTDYATRTYLGNLATWSCGAWVKFTLSGGIYTIHGIVKNNSGEQVNDFMLAVRDNGTATVVNFRTAGGDENSFRETASGVVASNTWTHIFATWDGTTTRVYVNGSEVSFATSTNPESGWGNAFRVGTIFLGAGYYANGSIHDVRVYSSAKTAGEVASIYAGQTDETGLLAWYPLSDGPGSDGANRTLLDVAGSNNLTVVGGTVANQWANRTSGLFRASQYALQTIVPRQQQFRRRADDGTDRILIYDDTLSGTDLTNVEGYVA